MFCMCCCADVGNTFVSARLELLLRDAQALGAHSQAEARAYLGHYFRGFLPLSDRYTDEQAGAALVDTYLFVHTPRAEEKLDCLLLMLRKLLSFAQGRCCADNSDAFMNHELLLPGHLLTMFLREKLEEALLTVRTALMKDSRTNRPKLTADMATERYWSRQFDRACSGLGGRARTLLSTGNLVSGSGMDLMQVSGFTVVAERLNIYRYLSHFQSVHRGQFFTTMKTTAVRKLLPESWGYLCPVHTPDGSPCGLLNHLARDAVVLTHCASDLLPMTPAGRLSAGAAAWAEGDELRRLLVGLGLVPGAVGAADGRLVLGADCLTVALDGVVLGGLPPGRAQGLVDALRRLKTLVPPRVDPTLEVAYIPPQAGGAYPGLFLFSAPGRLVRAVRQLSSGRTEYIGAMEQVYLDIAVLEADVRPETTHCELGPAVMLSQVAALMPFSASAKGCSASGSSGDTLLNESSLTNMVVTRRSSDSATVPERMAPLTGSGTNMVSTSGSTRPVALRAAAVPPGPGDARTLVLGVLMPAEEGVRPGPGGTVSGVRRSAWRGERCPGVPAMELRLSTGGAAASTRMLPRRVTSADTSTPPWGWGWPGLVPAALAASSSLCRSSWPYSVCVRTVSSARASSMQPDSSATHAPVST